MPDPKTTSSYGPRPAIENALRLRPVVPTSISDDPSTAETEEEYVEFPIPQGFQPPVGCAVGDKFYSLATLQLQDGCLCLLELDGTIVEPEADEVEVEYTDPAPKVSEFLRSKLVEIASEIG